MTVVTGISLYSDPGVICVIAVTAQKFDEPTFACSLGAVLDAQRLQHLIGKLAANTSCPTAFTAQRASFPPTSPAA